MRNFLDNFPVTSTYSGSYIYKNHTHAIISLCNSDRINYIHHYKFYIRPSSSNATWKLKHSVLHYFFSCHGNSRAAKIFLRVLYISYFSLSSNTKDGEIVNKKVRYSIVLTDFRIHNDCYKKLVQQRILYLMISLTITIDRSILT